MHFSQAAQTLHITEVKKCNRDVCTYIHTHTHTRYVSTHNPVYTTYTKENMDALCNASDHTVVSQGEYVYEV